MIFVQMTQYVPRLHVKTHPRQYSHHVITQQVTVTIIWIRKIVELRAFTIHRETKKARALLHLNSTATALVARATAYKCYYRDSSWWSSVSNEEPKHLCFGTWSYGSGRWIHCCFSLQTLPQPSDCSWLSKQVKSSMPFSFFCLVSEKMQEIKEGNF